MRASSAIVTIVGASSILLAGCTPQKDPELAEVMAEAKAAMHRAPTAEERAKMRAERHSVQTAGLRWDGVSRLKSEATPAELQRVANDPSVPRDKRAEAIFSLFANHVKVPQGAAEVGKALNSENWLNDSTVHGLSMISGPGPPVEIQSEETIFYLHLFPE